jgi:prepilin-type processing-associated H-X9-DG protein
MMARRGFAPIEVLVVCAVLTVGAGVVMSAVQNMGETEKRTKCANNLKQLGQAALNYEANHFALPPSAISKNNHQPPYIPYLKGAEAAPGKPVGTFGRSSGLVTLLLYLDKNDVTSQYTYGRDWSDPVNAKVLKVLLAGFRCPSVAFVDEAVPAYETTYITPGNDAFAPPNQPGSATNILGAKVYPGAKVTATGWAADYAPLTQVKVTRDPQGNPNGYANPLVKAAYPKAVVPFGGAMRVNGTTRLTDITDGTSYTIVYGEAAGRSRQCWAGGKCQPFDATKQAGPIWADADNRLTVTGTDATGKDKIGEGGCAVNCNNLVGDLYSFHPNGANVAFADGSVRFLKQAISITTLAALVTRSGGEKIDPKDY